MTTSSAADERSLRFGRWLRSGRWLDPWNARCAPLRSVPPWLVAAAAVVLVVVIWAVFQHAELYLGHDESIYAGKSRSWLTGTPAAGWGIYRPPALPMLGYVALAIHDSTGAIRVVGLLLNLLAVVLVYAVAARVSTPRRAAVAVLVMISGATFLRRLPEFLDDIPSSGLLLLVAYLVLRSRRPGGWWALPAAAAGGVLTLIVRFGAGAGLVSIMLAAIVVWGPVAWVRAWRPVGAAAAVAVVCLLPLAIYSERVSGSWIGVIATAQATPYRLYFAEGLVYYLTSYPLKLAGLLGGVVMTAGLVAGVASGQRLLRGGRGRGADQERLFLALAAVIQVIVLGLLTHGETRYIYFSVLALTVVGVDAIARTARNRSAVVMTGTAVVALGATAATSVPAYRTLTKVSAELAPTVQVAAQFRNPARGQPPCLVITRLHVVAAWVSGCDAQLPASSRLLPAADTVYVIEFAGTAQGPVLRHVRSLEPGRTWSVRPVDPPLHRANGVPHRGLLAVSPPA